MIIGAIYGIVVLIGLVIALAVICYDGTPVDDRDWRTILINRADEQHAALMRGDLHLGIYGKYPPVEADRGQK